MPPKGKSSSGSSHSSRSRSSSSSSRSRSSSSSSRSSRSSYSGSSHSSRSYTTSSTSSYRKSGVYTGSSSREYRYPEPRRGTYAGSVLGAFILHDALHEYTYVPNDYTDSDGVKRQSGYYDENGTYYQKGNFDNQTMELTCPYCDTKSKIVWTEGALPKCPVCGGEYELPQQSAANTYSTYSSSEKRGRPKKRKHKGLIILAVITAAFAGLGLYGSTLDKGTTNAGFKTTQQVQQSSAMDIYVEEIGRTCSWDSEYGWWVDKKSGCYFYFDETIAPSQWKYWYDGIGDDYGDFGWMEYDDDEKQWYIETSAKNWEVLPDHYDKTGLWHMRDAFQGPVRNE